jgi:hypothetical protein
VISDNTGLTLDRAAAIVNGVEREVLNERNYEIDQ